MMRGLPLVALAALVSAQEEKTVRGVPKTESPSYFAGEKFKCRDGSAEVPLSYVNDDYCDCFDGSDEPGTSACSFGKFWCENKGYKGFYVFSSMVNDAICDCCDGSDEFAKVVECPNTCWEKGAKAREEAVERAKVLKEGAVVRQGYEAQAEAAKADWERQLVELKADLEVKKGAQAEVEAKKNAAEEVEKAMQDEWKAKKDAEEAAKKAEEEAKAATAAPETEAAPDAAAPETPEAEAAPAEGAAAAEETATQPPAAEAAPEGGEAPAEGEKKEDWMDSRWMRMDDAPKEGGDGEEAAPEMPEGGDDEMPEHDEEEDDEEDSTPAPAEPEEKMPTNEEAEALRTEFNTAKSAVSDIERKIEDIEKKQGLPTGVKGEFFPLNGQCYDYHTSEYTYQLCPFDKVVQKEKNGGGSTTMGSWKEWEGEGFTKMAFKNGQRCWGGPDRECIVSVECGAENKVLHVDEPERCIYAMKFATPAACTDTDAQLAAIDVESEAAPENYES